jgi:hypothetical protein
MRVRRFECGGRTVCKPTAACDAGLSEDPLVLAHCPPAMGALDSLAITTHAKSPEAEEPQPAALAPVLPRPEHLRWMRIVCTDLWPFASLPSLLTHLAISITLGMGFDLATHVPGFAGVSSPSGSQRQRPFSPPPTQSWAAAV